MTDGIILLDKKPGITSMASDNFIKKTLATKKVGHSGTLDPFATGLLPVFVGKALKVMRYTDGYDKAYRCTACFGKTTDTLDTEGEIIDVNLPSEDELEAMKNDDFRVIRDAFEQLTHITEQIPPKFSAKKINGRKAYELAREGREVELKPHAVTIKSIDIISITPEAEGIFVTFDVYCSKGTYIRTLCDDAGRITGLGAHAVSLRRIASGPFRIEDAVTEEQIAEMVQAGDYSFIREAELALTGMPVYELNDKEYSDVLVGKKIKAKDNIEPDIRYAAYHDGDLTAVLYLAEENGRRIMRIERMLKGNA
jgi:tRNA pseudouridine55 synthase